MLIALLAEHPRPISADRLSELLWPEAEPDRRRLWDNVYRLRQALEVSGSDLGITRSPTGYAFDQPVSLDSQRFMELLRRAEALLDTAAADALGLMDEALHLWRGQPFEGYDIEVFAPGLFSRLNEHRLHAVLTRARARLSTAEPGAVVGELEDLTIDHPYNEHAMELLVTALSHSGRRVEALRRLRAFKEKLTDDLGLDAGPWLANLEDELLINRDTPPHRQVDPVSSPESADLPKWRTSFVGRDEITLRLSALLEENSLVTVVGPGGVGKTRLAVEAAQGLDVDDPGTGREIRFVDLAVITDPSSVDAVAAAACGIRTAAPREALIQFLRPQPTLLVIDNCEHVLDAISDLVDQILNQADGTRILATSRERLRVGGERVLRLEPLSVESAGDVSPAAALFCERAGLQPTELSDGDRTVVNEIVGQLDGLPLAIELAAARSDALKLSDLASGLDHRYQLLTSGERTAPLRHRTLQATVEWSFNQLSPDQQAVLARSSSFASRFTLDDAAAVCSDSTISPARVRTAVADLVDASLIDHDGGGSLPYRLLETLRHFGVNQLDAADERATWIGRHGEYFTTQACELAKRGYGPSEVTVVEELLARSDEYRNAIRSLRSLEEWEHLADLIWGLTTTAFSMRGTWLEPIFLVADIALDVPDPPPQRWSALISVVASTLHFRELFDQAEEATSVATGLAPDSFLPWAHASYAIAPLNPPLGIERAERALACSDPERPEELLQSLAALTNAKRIAGDSAGALDAAQRLVHESRRFQSKRGESIGMAQVARALPLGAPGAAEAARMAFEFGQQSRTSVAQITGAMLHIRHLLADDLETAAEALLEYLALRIVHPVVGSRTLAAAAAYFAVVGAGDLASRLGDLLGQTNIRDFAGYPAVDDLLQRIPVRVDPLAIDPDELEAMTNLAIARLSQER